ncbi:MAG: cation:proton antiporter [Candidatus Thermoplasmatota archaeon]|nr:cation:proton antiporter [Candidatus Thermoplasmatota archaeon]
MLLEISLALILAKILGYIFEKMKQPGVIGEILAGIILGPFIIGKFSGHPFSFLGFKSSFTLDLLSPEFEAISTLGIITLLFLSGLETSLGGIKSSGKGGVITALFNFVVSFVSGYLVGMLLGLNIIHSVAIGTIMVATSVGITVRTLMDMNALYTPVGTLILTVAIIDDVLAILMLSVILGTGSVPVVMLKVVFFFLLSIGVILYLVKKFFDYKKLVKIPKIVLTSSLALCFFMGALAAGLGLAAITGAFVAGLIVSATSQRRKVREYVRQLGEVFLIPLFFVWVGASFDFSAMNDIGTLVLLFVPMAFIGKIVGCTAGAKISGFNFRDALSVGIGMMPRMEVALVVVTMEISAGIFTGALAHQIFAATILLVILSSFLTPPLLKLVYRKRGNESVGHSTA